MLQLSHDRRRHRLLRRGLEADGVVDVDVDRHEDDDEALDEFFSVGLNDAWRVRSDGRGLTAFGLSRSYWPGPGVMSLVAVNRSDLTAATP